MSPVTLAHLFKPAKVDIGVFIGVAWGGVAVAALCIVGRIYIRAKTHRRLFADDWLILIAWSMLLANAIIWQAEKEDLYGSIGALSGELNQPLEVFMHETERYLRAIAAVVVLFYSSLWSIKFSFLMSFRPLGDKVERQRILWWSVFAITVATYFGSIGTVDYKCLTYSFSYLETECATNDAIKRQRLSLHSNTVLDVVTDFLIILVPVNLLWKVQISLRRKLALATLFSVTILIMVFAIIRVAVVSSYSHQPDQTWLFMWDSVEQTVAILVACLFSFRALFTRSSRRNRLPEVENQAVFPKALLPMRKRQHGLDDLTTDTDSFPTVNSERRSLDGSRISDGSTTLDGSTMSDGNYDLPKPPATSAKSQARLSTVSVEPDL